MSLFKEYLEETQSRGIIERDWGFITYTLSETECYIEDIYIVPEERKNGRGAELEQLVSGVAKQHGCTALTGSVIPSYDTSTESMKVLLARGFRIYNSTNNFIGLFKEIK